MVNLLLRQSHRVLIGKELRLAVGAFAIQVGTVLDLTTLAKEELGGNSDHPSKQLRGYKRSKPHTLNALVSKSDTE